MLMCSRDGTEYMSALRLLTSSSSAVLPLWPQQRRRLHRRVLCRWQLCVRARAMLIICGDVVCGIHV